MKNKTILTIAAVLALGLPLAACDNQTSNDAETKTTSEETGSADTNDKVEDKEATKESKDENSTSKSDIYDLEMTYLPEDFVENFKDEKKDLRTIEYTAEKNPAKKITLQITGNDERLKEIVTVPEDAEDITIADNTGKYWEDDSFNYIVIKSLDNNIYARSTIDKDEASKVVEGIK